MNEPKLIGFRDGPGTIQAEFEDGVRLNIHRGKGSGWYYALRPFTPEFLCLPPAQARTYQATAFESFFSGTPHTTKFDSDGKVLIAKLGEAGRREKRDVRHV